MSKIYFISIGFIVFTTSLFVGGVSMHAYAPTSTHAGITQELLSFYEFHTGETWTEEEALLIVQASIDEDVPAVRALNHFYDPVHGSGINQHRASPDWATDPNTFNEFTWQKGIDAYAKGDEKMAWIVLGHVLHLIEDASVPDHTRNDPHMGHGASGLNTGASPLEDWAHHHKDRSTMQGYGSMLAKQGVSFAPCDSLKECFDRIALYSNQNFYSADTIASGAFILPVIDSFDEDYIYAFDEQSGTKEQLACLEQIEGYAPFMSLVCPLNNHTVVPSYFDRIAPQAVSTGARVIQLYLNEARFARAEYERAQAEAQEEAVASQVALMDSLKRASVLDALLFGFKEQFVLRPIALVFGATERIADAGKGYVRTAYVLDRERNNITRAASVSLVRGTVVGGGDLGEHIAQRVHTVISPSLTELIQKLSDAKRILDALPRTSTPVTSSLALTFPISPTTSPHVTSPKEEGVVLGTSTALALLAPSTPEPRIDLGVPQGSVPLPLPPSAPRFLSPFQHDIFTTPHISVSGEGSATATITLMTEDALGTTISLATTDGTGAFTFPVTLHPGTTTLSLIEADIHHQLSPPAVLQVIFSPPLPSAPTILTTTTSPAYLSTTTLTLSGSADPDTEILLSYDTITQSTTTDSDGLFAFTIILPEGTTTLSLVAQSSYDMTSTTTLEVGVVVPPLAPASPVWPFGTPSIVFSEVAWSGTRADPTHEWLELYNLTYSNRPLANLFVVSEDRSFVIPLSGTIPAQGYVVIASNPGIFQNNTPFLTHPFAHELPDSGMHLLLVYGSPESTTVVSEIPYCTDWCGLGDGGKTVMFPWYSDGGTVWDYTKVESYSPRWWLPDEESWSGVLDSSGLPILGTPGESEPLAPFL